MTWLQGGEQVGHLRRWGLRGTQGPCLQAVGKLKRSYQCFKESDLIHSFTHPWGPVRVESSFYPGGTWGSGGLSHLLNIRQSIIESTSELGFKCRAAWIRHRAASADTKLIIHSHLQQTSPKCLLLKASSVSACTGQCWGHSGNLVSPGLALSGLTDTHTK